MKKLAPLPVLLVLAGCGGATDLGPAPKAKSQAAAKLTSPTAAQKLVPLKIWLVREKGLVQRNRAHPKTVRVARRRRRCRNCSPVRRKPSGAAPLSRRRYPGGSAPARHRHRQWSRHRRPYLAVPGGRRLKVAPASTGAGRLHAHGVPERKRVRFELDGSTVNVLSNQGVVSDHPVGRKDYGEPDCAGIPASKQGFVVVNSPQPSDDVGPQTHGPRLLELVRGNSELGLEDEWRQ